MSNSVKEAFSNTRLSVENSPSSIFTRDDVLRLLGRLENSVLQAASDNDTFDSSKLKDAMEQVIRAIDGVDGVDTSDCEVDLSLDRMEITVESVEVNGLDDAISDLRSACDDLRDLFDEMNKK